MNETEQNQRCCCPRYPIFDSIDEAFFFCLDGFKKLDHRSKQLGIMECIRIMDLFFFRSTRSTVTEKDKSDYEQAVRYGYPIFLKYFYEDFSNIEQCLLSPSNEFSLKKSIEKINLFSFKGLSDHYQDLLSHGAIKVKSYRKNHLMLSFVKNPAVALIEREYLKDYSNYIQLLLIDEYNELFARIDSIVQIMDSLVHTHKEHFIGYDSAPEIEKFFFDNAMADTFETPEWYAFPRDCTFGGITYDVYVDTVVCFVGFSLKHLQYCLLLIAKDPNVRLENILTVIEDHDTLLMLIMERNSLSKSEAQNILNLISLNIDNSQSHTQIRSAAPPLIQISKTQYIRSICGCLNHPFQFLLDGLHEMYKYDWDRNTKLRELEFKNELYNLFRNQHVKCVDHPIKIWDGSRLLTDIDACMIDRITGEIVFFQLKWQDLPNASNQKIISRMCNFEDEVNRWLDVVNQWISNNSAVKLSSILHLPSKGIDLKKIRLIALGRFNSYDTNYQFPVNAAWGQWYQVFLHFSKLSISERTLYELFRYLKSLNEKYEKAKPIPGGMKFREFVLQVQ